MRRWVLLASSMLLLFGMAGCGGNKPIYPAGTILPGDPPPTPGRKPPVPVGFRAPAIDSLQTGDSGETESALTAAPAAAISTESLPAPEAAPSIARTTPQAPPADGRYKVQLGDTLFGISRRFGLPIRSLIAANQLRPPYRLNAGRDLAIPNPRLHRVATGQTVYGIARLYGVSMRELVRINGIKPPFQIATGATLVLPGPARPSVGAAAPAESMPSVPTVETTASTTPAVEKSPEIAPTRTSAARRAIPQPPARSGGKFLWPVEGKIVSAFGAKGGGRHNDGINILAPRGSPVRAAENAVVVYADDQLKGFGGLILLKHADGWVTAYAHNNDLLVRRGDIVKRGQVIARSGASGNVSSPQLHFEVRKGTRALNPVKVLEASSISAG